MQIFTVSLQPGLLPFSEVHFRRRNGEVKNYDVIHVDAQKFLHFFEIAEGYFVPHFSKFHPSYQEDMLRYMSQNQHSDFLPDMPMLRISMEHRTFYPRYFHSFFKYFGLFGKSQLVPIFQFVNGRHRTRFLQFAGAKSFYVEVANNDSSSDLMKSFCGIQS